MAIAIFNKNTNQFHKCLETSSKVTECGYDNADWWKNVTVSDSDWAAIIAGTKLPVSVNDSNEISWEENFTAISMGVEFFKSHVAGILSILDGHLQAKKFASYSGRSEIQAYRDWLHSLDLDSITFPVTDRFEDWVTAQGGTPVSLVTIP
jgi:hypothetical protein